MKRLVAALAASLALAAGAGALLVRRMMEPAMKPVERLRDVAVAMAGGDLEARADEGVDDVRGVVRGREGPVAALDDSRHAEALEPVHYRLRRKIIESGLDEIRLRADVPGEAFQSFTFVKLQRPLPVIITLRAGRGIFSSTVTCASRPAPRAPARHDTPPSGRMRLRQ